MAFAIDANRPVRAFRQRIVQDIERFDIADRNGGHAAAVSALEHEGFLQGVLITFVDRQELSLILERFSIGANLEIGNQAGHGFAADHYIHETLYSNTPFLHPCYWPAALVPAIFPVTAPRRSPEPLG